jgi:hypothetical protein
LANQKVSEPFEILADLEDTGKYLLKGHENIELLFANSTTLIVTGYKMFEVTEVFPGS